MTPPGLLLLLVGGIFVVVYGMLVRGAFVGARSDAPQLHRMNPALARDLVLLLLPILAMLAVFALAGLAPAGGGR